MSEAANRTLLRNANIVLPTEVRQGSVLIEKGIILEVDAGSTVQADEVIDCTGLHLMPGVIDDQVHFREPGLTHKEDLESASRACAAGGVTIPRNAQYQAPCNHHGGNSGQRRNHCEKVLCKLWFLHWSDTENVQN